MKRKPEWLKLRFSTNTNFGAVRKLLSKNSLHTVCRSAMCPNLQECWSRGTATFLLLGNTCTRSCSFCAIDTDATPAVPDPEEPENIASAVMEMGLSYVVLTSVTRDDLPDGGAGHWIRVVDALRAQCPEVMIECLIPDFSGNEDAMDRTFAAAPDILNHNLETIHRLYPRARPEADYDGSLSLLRRARHQHGLITKSGIMVGMGESYEEVLGVLEDLADTGCSMVTIGQYLQPTQRHLPVERYVTPEEFARMRNAALGMGFLDVQSGPFIRSSYHADHSKQLFPSNNNNNP